MYPFPDYYAQFGIILNNTPYTSLVPLRYEIHEEALCLIVLLLLLGIEIFISIGEVLIDCLKTNNNDYLKALYEQKTDTSSAATKTHSLTDGTTHEGAFLLLNTSSKTISEEDVNSIAPISQAKF